MTKTELEICNQIISFHGIDKYFEIDKVIIIRDAVRKAFAEGVKFGVLEFREQRRKQNE